MNKRQWKKYWRRDNKGELQAMKEMSLLLPPSIGMQYYRLRTHPRRQWLTVKDFTQRRVTLQTQIAEQRRSPGV